MNGIFISLWILAFIYTLYKRRHQLTRLKNAQNKLKHLIHEKEQKSKQEKRKPGKEDSSGRAAN